ncbi:MAG: TIGR04255 family protein [Egibacteraceae bacterium]
MATDVKYSVNLMASVLRNPYPEVPLPEAPLALVLCQIRFPDTPALVDRVVLGRIKEGLHDLFPVMRSEENASFAVSMAPGNPPQIAANREPVTRFEQIDKSWFVTVNNQFLALSTTAYTSRKDFIARLRDVLAVVTAQADVGVCDRIGVRYVDQVADAAVLSDLPTFVNPALLGVLTLDASDGVAVVHALTESLLDLGGNTHLRSRCGVVPPATALDPSLGGIDQASWILDIDVFDSTAVPFTVDLADRAEQLATSAYQLFRWSVTDKFIRHFGGTS